MHEMHHYGLILSAAAEATGKASAVGVGVRATVGADRRADDTASVGSVASAGVEASAGAGATSGVVASAGVGPSAALGESAALWPTAFSSKSPSSKEIASLVSLMGTASLMLNDSWTLVASMLPLQGTETACAVMHASWTQSVVWGLRCSCRQIASLTWTVFESRSASLTRTASLKPCASLVVSASLRTPTWNAFLMGSAFSSASNCPYPFRCETSSHWLSPVPSLSLLLQPSWLRPLWPSSHQPLSLWQWPPPALVWQSLLTP